MFFKFSKKEGGLRVFHKKGGLVLTLGCSKIEGISN